MSKVVFFTVTSLLALLSLNEAHAQFAPQFVPPMRNAAPQIPQQQQNGLQQMYQQQQELQREQQLQMYERQQQLHQQLYQQPNTEKCALVGNVIACR
jgi:hypothetical protein